LGGQQYVRRGNRGAGGRAVIESRRRLNLAGRGDHARPGGKTEPKSKLASIGERKAGNETEPEDLLWGVESVYISK